MVALGVTLSPHSHLAGGGSIEKSDLTVLIDFHCSVKTKTERNIRVKYFPNAELSCSDCGAAV